MNYRRQFLQCTAADPLWYVFGLQDLQDPAGKAKGNGALEFPDKDQSNQISLTNLLQNIKNGLAGVKRCTVYQSTVLNSVSK